MFLKNPVFCRFAIKFATASALSAMPSNRRYRALVFYRVQPDRFRVVDRLADHRQQVDWIRLAFAAVARSRPPAACSFPLALPLQVIAPSRRPVRGSSVPPLSSWRRSPSSHDPAGTSSPVGHTSHRHDRQHFQLGRSHFAHFHRGHRGRRTPRLLFAFGVFSRLIRIIGIQSSSRPSPLPLPAGRDSAPPIPLPCPSTGGVICWNGLNNSTGIENSCRNASTSPGTFDEPPAR